MSSKIFIPMFLASALLFQFSSAGAAPILFDFAAYGDSNSGTPANDIGEQGGQPLTFTESGLTVTATGSHITDTTVFAYLDSGNAGLGVCKDLNVTDQCVPNSDDNVTAGETLKLVFSSPVILDPTFFRNAGHGTSYPASARIDISTGGAFSTYTLVNNFSQPLAGTTFEFRYHNDEFYIDTASATITPIPEPSTLLLSGLGLAGVYGYIRRRKLMEKV